VTCEVMLMNLQGVALAADSAVTVVSGTTPRSLSQTGVEKIFILDEGLPAGAMVYGLATFGEIPWKTVLSAFTAQAPGTVDRIADYAEGLVTFLGELDSSGGGGLKLTPAAEVDNLRLYVEGVVHRFATLAAQRVQAPNERITAEMLGHALDQLETEILYEADYIAEEIAKPSGQRVTRAVIGEPTARLADFLARHLDPALTRAQQRLIGRSPLPAPVRERLSSLCVRSVLVDWLPPAAPVTGLVIAGFGRKDYTPFFVNLHIQGAFGGVVQHRWEKAGAPIAGRTPVVFESYAQDELIQAFKSGAQQRFTALTYMASVAGLTQTFNDMLAMAARKDPALAQELAVIANRAVYAAPAIAIEHAVADREAHVARTFGPLLDSASPEGLGRHAAKLVQLSILEHELTGSGVVGRPISVMTMEKGRCRLERDVAI
jgi:hypothetical protein